MMSAPPARAVAAAHSLGGLQGSIHSLTPTATACPKSVVTSCAGMTIRPQASAAAPRCW